MRSVPILYVVIGQELVPTSLQAQDILTRGAMERETVTFAEVQKCLNDATVPFCKLEKLFENMVNESLKIPECKKLRIGWKREAAKAPADR